MLGGADTRGAEERWRRTQGAGGRGRGEERKRRPPRRGGAPGLREGSHGAAVLRLGWNAVHAQVLASGSADGTVKLWDVARAGGPDARPASTLAHHAGKVASLAWHHAEGALLATGGYDCRVGLVDARAADGGSAKRGM